ncbi:MAG: hypothetical protein IKM20_10375 [Erysipelotrichales bacterium]|nr:hypothetical protein [Erysipelotrichales bacterium]
MNFQKKVMEYLRICDKSNRIARTPFLSLDEQEILLSMTKHYSVKLFGGFNNSERQRVLIIPEDSYEDIDFDIDVICAKCDNNFYKITHSDVLGALMNIGIEREVTGDIVITDEYIYIALAKSITPFVVSELTRINKVNVSFEITEDIPKRELLIDEFDMIITSRRLDSVVSHLAKCGRKDAQIKIDNKEVKVNGFIATKYDKIVSDDSLISIRRAGRFIIYGEVGKTKKENIVLHCGKYS